MSATNRGGERKAYDFYATPPETIRSFLANFDGISSGDRILEPSAGNGQIIKVLRESGYDNRIDAVELRPEERATLEALADNVTMLNYAKKTGASIGDLIMQLDFMYQELKGYVAVFQVLRTAQTVKEASDIVLTKYERPADMSGAVKAKRASYGQAFYDAYTTEKEASTMSNSPLVTYTNITKNKTSPRNHAIDTITIHCIVGQWTAKQGCPGQYLYERHGAIAAAVNAILGSGTTQAPEAAPEAVQGFPESPFTVRVIVPDLNYRKGPGMSYAVKGQTGKGIFTITEVQDGWGKLKSGAGWIYLENPNYCTILGVASKPPDPDPADVLAEEIAGKVKGSGLDPEDILNRVEKILGVV